MRKANAMGLVIGGLVVGGGVIGAIVLGKKKSATAPAELPPGQPAAQPAQPALYPVPPIPQVPVAPAASETAVQSRVVAAIQTGNPAVMRQVAAQLRQEGNAQAAGTLEAYAASQETAATVVQGALNQAANVLAQPTPATPTPAPPPTVAPPVTAQPLPTVPQVPAVPPPAPAPATPAAQPTQYTPVTVPGIPGLTQPITYQVPSSLLTGTPLEQGAQPAAPGPTPAPAPITTGSPVWPEQDPGKRAVAIAMNVNLAGSTKGKENQSMVRAFQTQEAGKAGTVDGLYGPTVAKDLGTRYGIIPAKPLYWSSKSAVQPQKDAYNSWLSDMAAKDPVRVSEWGAAAVF